MSDDKTTLTDVSEDYRADSEVFITEMDGEFMFSRFDGSLKVVFMAVKAYVEYGSEYADFQGSEMSILLSNEESERWPHWIFEEFQHIQREGELRPVDDYETMHRLKDTRSIKGAS